MNEFKQWVSQIRSYQILTYKKKMKTENLNSDQADVMGCKKGAAVLGLIFKRLLKKDKQYVIRIPYIDGWICNGDFFFHVYNRTAIGFYGDRWNHNKLIFKISNL